MIVAGIDPSLKATAVVVGDSNEIFHGVFSSHRVSGSVKGRFLRYENQIAGICDFLVRYKPTVVYIEGYVFGRWDVTPITEYGAMLRWHLLDFGLVHEIPPSTLKVFATGTGGSKKIPCTKEMVASAVREKYGVEFGSHDEYDAYAAWRLGCVCEGEISAMHEYEVLAAKVVSGAATKRPKKKKPSRSTGKQAIRQKGIDYGSD